MKILMVLILGATLGLVGRAFADQPKDPCTPQAIQATAGQIVQRMIQQIREPDRKLILLGVRKDLREHIKDALNAACGN